MKWDTDTHVNANEGAYLKYFNNNSWSSEVGYPCDKHIQSILRKDLL